MQFVKRATKNTIMQNKLFGMIRFVNDYFLSYYSTDLKSIWF